MHRDRLGQEKRVALGGLELKVFWALQVPSGDALDSQIQSLSTVASQLAATRRKAVAAF